MTETVTIVQTSFMSFSAVQYEREALAMSTWYRRSGIHRGCVLCLSGWRVGIGVTGIPKLNRHEGKALRNKKGPREVLSPFGVM